MPHWLIVAGSARALAQSCVAAGWTCDVVDPYADIDTRALARSLLQAPLVDGRFGDDLPARIGTLDGGWCGVVAGSGFERCPDLLDALRTFAPVLGNDAAVTGRCKAPDEFSAALRQAGVAFAPVRSAGCADAGWLMKKTGDCGGAHVRPALDGEAIAPGWFAQRHIAGVPASVLFLADGRRARIVGVSRQAPGSPAGPFAWCEAIGDLPLADDQRAALERDVDAMTKAFGLRGLNGADLVFEGGRHVVVEINPRPAATMMLYEERVAGGLFAAHVAACAGRLPERIGAAGGEVRGLRVVHAPQALYVGRDIDWPEGCTDLPVAGSRIPAAAPLCTVHASAADGLTVSARLRSREQQVLDMFGLRSAQMTTTTVFS